MITIKNNFDSNKILVQPNQSLSVRDIIRQYVRGEVSATENVDSDDINTDNYTEEDVFRAIQFEDRFEAFEFMHTLNNQLKNRKNEKEIESSGALRESPEGTSREDAPEIEPPAPEQEGQTT